MQKQHLNSHASILKLFSSYIIDARVFQNRGFGPGTNQFWLSNVNCNGDEERFIDCTHPPLGVHNCGRDDINAGVTCVPSKCYTVSHHSLKNLLQLVVILHPLETSDW